MHQFQVRPESGGRAHSKSANRKFYIFCLIASGVAAISGCGGVSYKNAHGVILSQISCGTQSLTGPQTKSCTVSLSAAAITPINVKLTSSNSSLQIPSALTIAIGQSSASFNAVATGVSKSVSVIISGSSRGVTKTAVITLYPAPVTAPLPTPYLTGISCASQSLTGPTTTACNVHLSSAANSPMSVTLASSSNSLQIPQTIIVNAGATTAGFNATASAVSATQNITLTATSGGVSLTDVIQLIGSTGQATTQHHVNLTWAAPNSSPSPVISYNIYRASSGLDYQFLNSVVEGNTSYTDAAVQSGQTYTYVVKSLDGTGVESAPSNQTTVTIP